MRNVSAAIFDFMKGLAAGAFKAPRASVPRLPTLPANRQPRGPRVKRAPPAAPAPRSPTAGEAALAGVQFEEDRIEWRVLKVGWSEEYEEVVVWYFDTAMAVDAELNEEDMEVALAAGELLCPVEVYNCGCASLD